MQIWNSILKNYSETPKRLYLKACGKSYELVEGFASEMAYAYNVRSNNHKVPVDVLFVSDGWQHACSNVVMLKMIN